MFDNYLKSALRNLARNRLYAVINVVGLAVGFCVAILIWLYVRDELRYDRFIPGADNVYAVYTIFDKPGRRPVVADMTAGDIAGALKLDFPSIQALSQLLPRQSSFRRGDVEDKEGLWWADANVFSVIPLPFFKGDPQTALQAPDTIVLTRRLARKYFGSDDPRGQTLEIRGPDHPPRAMMVTAILEDLPSNTSLSAEIFASDSTSISGLAQNDAPQSGFLCNTLILLRMPPGPAIDALRRALPDFLKRHRKISPGDQGKVWFELRSLTALHLMPSELHVLKPSSDRTTIYSISVVGVLIVLIASINFVNLMTARSTKRAVEVGIRKVSGARRRDLIIQFIGESLLYALLGMVLALALTVLLLPAFSAFLDRHIVLSYADDVGLVAVMAAMVLFVGILAGAYPAFVLSAFSPAATFKSAVAQTSGSGLVRQTLVITQFTILTGLLITTGIIYQQMKYAMNEVLRFNKDQILVIFPPRINDAYQDALRSLPGVAGLTTASVLAMNFGQLQSDVIVPGGVRVPLYHSSVDFGFFELYGLRPLAGRVFSRDRGADAVSTDPKAVWDPPIVINESAARIMGFKTPEAAVGRTATLTKVHDGPTGPSDIIGVVPDFSLKSVRHPVNPMIYYVDHSQNGILSVRLKGRDIPETLAAIDSLGKKIDGSSMPPGRVFLDQYLHDLYSDVTRQGALFSIFSCVAVFIACLGLLGLSAFTAERRTKEIGIRKAMGAYTSDITRLLVWQFTKPVLWANLLSWPLAGYSMYRWLQGFAYHVDLQLWVFVVAAGTAALIALLTVTGHCYLVARAKPVLALRYE